MAIYFYADKNGKKTSVTGGQLERLIAGGVIRSGTVISTEDGSPLIVGEGGVLLTLNGQPNTTKTTQNHNGTMTTKPPFCTNCGNSVASSWSVVCRSCGANYNEHKKFCQHCGTALNPEQVVCIKCKKRIGSNSGAGGGSVFMLVWGVIAGVWGLSSGYELLGIIVLVAAIGNFLKDLVKSAKR